MRPSYREPTTDEIRQLKILCIEKADKTGLTDPKQILRAVMDDLRSSGRTGTLAQRLASIEPNLATAATTARKRRQRRQNTEKHSRRRARKANVHVEPVDRAAIIRRDKSTCYLCGLRCKPHEIHLDHVMPISKGGEHTADNLRVTCAPCNIRKGANIIVRTQSL